MQQKYMKQITLKFHLMEIYRNEAARFAGVNQRTLRSYEDGERKIRIITFYKLVQLYEVVDISDFLCNIARKMKSDNRWQLVMLP